MFDENKIPTGAGEIPEGNIGEEGVGEENKDVDKKADIKESQITPEQLQKTVKVIVDKEIEKKQ